MTIILNADTRYTFEVYFIIRDDDKLKYKCDSEKFNIFLDKYVSD